MVWCCMQEGSVHTVKVIRMMDFGAIVEFPSGSSSLLHISQISHTRVGIVHTCCITNSASVCSSPACCMLCA